MMTLDEVTAYLAGDKIECLICGRQMVSLGIHLARYHGIEPASYRATHGIPSTWPLEAKAAHARRSAGRTPELREQARQLGKTNAGRPSAPQTFSAATRELRKRQHKKMTEEVAARRAALAALSFGS